MLVIQIFYLVIFIHLVADRTFRVVSLSSRVLQSENTLCDWYLVSDFNVLPFDSFHSRHRVELDMFSSAVPLHCTAEKILATAQNFAVPCNVTSRHCAVPCSGFCDTAKTAKIIIIDTIGQCVLGR